MTLFAKNNGNSGKNNIVKILFGAAVGVAVYFVLLFIFAFVMTVTSVPETAAVVFSFAALAVGSFFSGFVALWKIGSSGLVNGIICGAVLSVLHLAAALLFGDGGNLVYLTVSVVIELLLSTFGGVVSVNARAE